MVRRDSIQRDINGSIQSGAPHESVAEDVKVPGLGEKSVTNGVAVPKFVVSANIHAKQQIRSFDVSLGEKGFFPSTIIVNKDDIVHLEIMSEKEACQFAQSDYGLLRDVGKGKRKIVEFQATSAGKYVFHCENDTDMK